MIAVTECPSTDELRAFSLGELPEEQSDALFRHLQDCPTCKSELETVGDTEDSLITSLRRPDGLADFDREPDCKLAVAKALGALAAVGESTTSTDLDRLPKSLGEYEIIRPLARGGMGSVYLARHTKLGREVALKFLADHRLADPRMKERFEAEMRAVGRLSHPNIVTAHDAREVDGTAVLVTEYIDGFDLGALVARTSQLNIADACEIVRQVALALEYTSGQGFVHRDVKPSNIMLSTAGEVKLLDLGLARLQYGQHDGLEITASGQAMGTADYVAPEQVSDSRNVDIRADIYSLGCTLFKLLTGHAPFSGHQYATVFAKMTAHVSAQPPSLRDVIPGAPARLVKLVDSMLSKNPADRPQTPIAVAEKLTELAADSDLKQLARQAASLPASSGTPDSVSSPSPSAAVALPWFSRPVPTYVAIGAGFFGALLGLLMGIVITITYPDGTKVTIPVTPGSQVAIDHVPDDKPADAAVNAAASDLEYAPLAFVVLVNAGERSADAIDAAKKILQTSDGRDFVRSDAGTWYRITDDDIQVPVSATHRGHRYALASDESDSRIGWNDLQGHIVGAQGGGHPSRIQLEFDDQLAKRMSYVTGKNVNRQLAVVVDHRIVSAPKIQSQISSRAVVTGNLLPEETRFILQAIQGGLVTPLNRTDVSMVTRLQGIWKVVSVEDASGLVPNPRLGKMVINDDRFLLVDDRDREISALGTFRLQAEDQLTRVNFDYVIGEGSDQLVGMVEFLPNGRLSVEHKSPGPAGTPVTTMAIQLEHVGAFPKTAPALWSMLLGDEERQLRVSHADASDTIFRFMQDGDLSAAELEKLRQAIRNAKSQTTTRNNLKYIGIAFHNYHEKFKKFPGSVNGDRGISVQPYSWRVAILPYLNEVDLFNQYRFDQPWDSEANLKLVEKMPTVYRSPYAPADQPVGHTNYQGFATEESALGTEDGHAIHEVLDGTANTLLMIESANAVPWTKPEDLTETPKFFPGRSINLLMLDGSVHTKDNIDEALLKKLITRDGGEVIEW